MDFLRIIIQKFMKRLISCLVIFCFVFSSVCYGQSNQKPSVKPVTIQPSEEVKRAISYGFVPKEIQSNFETAITFSQYCSMLSKMIAFYNKSLVPNFEKHAKLAMKSKSLMKREDGMLAIYYAAITMNIGASEDNFSNSDYTIWIKINDLCGEKAWNDFSWKYPLFPNWNQNKLFNGNYMSTAYFLCMAQYSCVSGKTLFDFDEKNKSMHVNLPFTRQDAICSVARLYESTGKFSPKERTQTQWDKKFLESYNKRLDSILHSETTIIKSSSFIPGQTYTGTAYYISPKGDDKNDGLSPNTPWATLHRTNEQVKQGDAVFLERNGVWREELDCVEGATYSAYGTGNKPRIYGSQENGADTGKWTLWYQDKTGKKVWKFYKDVLDCGGIVFNDGGSYASRVFSYWDGNKYVFLRNHNKPFNISQGLEYNLQFYSTFDASKYSLPILTFDIDTRGPLYLRCDGGNPGELYKSIEFQTASKPEAHYWGLIQAKNGSVIDNLCAMYGISRGISTGWNSNALIQNCEVAWIGGGTHEIDTDYYHPGSGEGIGIEGSNNTAKNCYVHDCWDGGIISELLTDFPYYVENQTIEGNIIERCMSGILVFSHNMDKVGKPIFGNLKITDNLIMYSGYGWSCDMHYDFGNAFMYGGRKYFGNAISFYDDCPNLNNGILINNNTLYLAKSALLRLGMDKKYWPVLKGNTYVQNQYCVVGAMGLKLGCSNKGPETQKFIQDIMGDKTPTAIQPN